MLCPVQFSSISSCFLLDSFTRNLTPNDLGVCCSSLIRAPAVAPTLLFLYLLEFEFAVVSAVVQLFYFEATTAAAAVFACLVWFITLKWRRTKSSSAIATRVVVVHLHCTAHYTLLYTKLKIYGVFCFLLLAVC